MKIWTITIANELAGLCIWQEPSVQGIQHSYCDSDAVTPLFGLLGANALSKLGNTARKRLRKSSERSASVCKKLCPEPHWTLSLVAISKQHQLQGNSYNEAHPTSRLWCCLTATRLKNSRLTTKEMLHGSNRLLHASLF